MDDWKPIDAETPKGELLLGWWAEGMAGKGLPFILMWGKYLDGSPDGKMCWLDFQRAYPCQPSLWKHIVPPESSHWAKSQT